jgi:hypothetical protein
MDTKTNAGPPDKPQYWAVIPSGVRYDPDLPAAAKLLYAEISSLTDRAGYCFASNAYFVGLFEMSERTLQRHLKTLEARGYIRIADGSGGAGRRKIYAGINPLCVNPDKNDGVTPTKMTGPPDKNVTHNKKENRKETNPPIAPQGASVPKWKPERFEAFWRYYPAIPDGNGRGRRPAKDRAARAWDKLHADDSEIDLMAAALQRQKQSRQWRDGVGIPYASTWLNGRMWREEVEELSETGDGGPPRASAPTEGALPWI